MMFARLYGPLNLYIVLKNYILYSKQNLKMVAKTCCSFEKLLLYAKNKHFSME